ncbi:MAG: pesticin C-terminus-like muramidase [Sulfurimicrobium sp.]|nr:pesticin C-terminus-like muramidase [Sulfurimicrobium sp.]MDP2198922.1 pesticin C-terminus-like muramidase [Sulfurimicrobium sp.]
MKDAMHQSTPIRVIRTLLLAVALGLAAAVAALPLQQPKPACDPSKASCVDGTPTKPECPGTCLGSLEMKMQFVRSNNCTLHMTDACTEEWRVDKEFLEESEGALETTGYVPTDKNGKAIASSGVTISTGVDLGQQDAAGTKAVLDAYIKVKGNPDKVDVAALMKKLDPYFGLQKQKALDELAKTPLTVTKAEARLLADAFGYDTQKQVAKRFDKKNTQGMVFNKLPTEAQTVIVDFAYQYGVYSDAKGVGKTFWTYVYDGEWKKLADWLLSLPDQYTKRRYREGDAVQFGIENDYLPESGNPCPPASQSGGNQNKP